MKTVGEFKKAGVVFVVDDKGNDFYVRNPVLFNNNGAFDYDEVISFAWRDLTTKPDDLCYKIELDVDNHRWRPSLNNPKLEELKDIIGTHDDPTECAKAILAAGYNK